MIRGIGAGLWLEMVLHWRDGGGLLYLDFYFVDSAAVHVHYGHFIFGVVNDLPRLGDGLQFGEYKSAQRFIIRRFWN